MKRLFILIGFISGTLYSSAFGQSKVINGLDIKGTEHWSGKITIAGDVLVEPRARLVIDAGTVVSFKPNSDLKRSGRDKTRSEIIVRGVLIARGSINSKIKFTSQAKKPQMDDWYGITISNPRHPSVLDYVVVEYAYNGITIKKSNPQISNSQIRFNFNAGLSIEIGAKPKLIGNIISENGYAGIICNTGAKPILTDNMITRNDIGIIIFGTAQPNLGSLAPGADHNVGRNGLFGNRTYNIHNHSGEDIKAENNSWGSKKTTAIKTTIYDNEDDRKYGLVDITPIMGSRLQMDQKIMLSQGTTASGTPASRKPQAPSVGKPIVKKETQQVASGVAGSVRQGTLARNLPKKALQPKKLESDTLRLAAGITAKSMTVKLPEVKVKKPDIDYNQVFLDVFLDKGRKVVKKVQPIIEHPDRVRNARGKVIVHVVVDRQGKIESANILRGLNSYYNQLALDAARKFIFLPGTVKGIPVRFSTSLVFEF